MLGLDLRAREPPLDPGRMLAHRVLHLRFQVHDRIRAHWFSSPGVSVGYGPAADTPQHALARPAAATSPAQGDGVSGFRVEVSRLRSEPWHTRRPTRC